MNKWILLAFLAFVGVLLPQSRNYPYYNGDYHAFVLAQEISSNSLSAFKTTPPYDRRSPPLVYVLFLEKSVFGLRPLPYFFILFLTHFLNALLVTRAWRTLGGTASASTLSGLLFLCSSSTYQNLIFIHATQRVLCILLFLLATHSWIDFLRSRTLFSFVKTMTFQGLSLLTMEDAAVFPFIALFLCFRLVTKEAGRNTVLIRYWPWLMVTNALLLIFMLQAFVFSPLRGEKISVPTDLIAKVISLVEVFFRPLLIPERGLLASFFIQENMMMRLLPALVLFVLFLCLFSKRERLQSFLTTLPRPQLMTATGWILITTVPFLLQNLSFEHANRYLYLPMAGFSFFFGSVVATLIETVRKFLPNWAMMICWSLMASILLLGLETTAFQYRRYTKYVEENPEEHYYDEVKRLFEGPQ